ncbi:hypothetical protein MKX01_005637, partial [Papaver californicum]
VFHSHCIDKKGIEKICYPSLVLYVPVQKKNRPVPCPSPNQDLLGWSFRRDA